MPILTQFPPSRHCFPFLFSLWPDSSFVRRVFLENSILKYPRKMKRKHSQSAKTDPMYTHYLINFHFTDFLQRAPYFLGAFKVTSYCRNRAFKVTSYYRNRVRIENRGVCGRKHVAPTAPYHHLLAGYFFLQLHHFGGCCVWITALSMRFLSEELAHRGHLTALRAPGARTSVVETLSSRGLVPLWAPY
jgi:hypothetical protein